MSICYPSNINTLLLNVTTLHNCHVTRVCYFRSSLPLRPRSTRLHGDYQGIFLPFPPPGCLIYPQPEVAPPAAPGGGGGNHWAGRRAAYCHGVLSWFLLATVLHCCVRPPRTAVVGTALSTVLSGRDVTISRGQDLVLLRRCWITKLINRPNVHVQKQNGYFKCNLVMYHAINRKKRN